MSHNFDIFAARTRRKEHDNAGDFNTPPWDDTYPGQRDMWRSITKATLDCLVEDGYDFGGLEEECDFECLG